MKIRILAGLLLVALAFSLALPLHAQDSALTPEEEALVMDVQDAFEALFSTTTFQASVETLISQDIHVSSGGQEIDLRQVIEQLSEVRMVIGDDGEIAESYSLLTQNTSITANVPGVSQEIPLVMEGVQRGEDYHLRVLDAAPQLSSVFPEGWFRPEDLQIPGFDFGAMADLGGRETLAVYDVNANTVATIEEREGTSIDGLQMRVISLTFHPEVFFEIAGLDALFDPQAVGASEDFFSDMLEATTFEYTIYIGVDDGIPHLVENISTITDMETEVQGEALILSQDSTVSVTYFAFGEPVEIPEPDLGE